MKWMTAEPAVNGLRHTDPWHSGRGESAWTGAEVVLLEVLNMGERKVPTSIDTRCATCTAAHSEHERKITIDLTIRGGNQIALRSCRKCVALATGFSTSCIKG
jgi:hypothetical protein